MGSSGTPAQILHDAAAYATTVEPAIRTSLRARVLHQLENMVPTGPAPISVDFVPVDELSNNASLLGAVLLHVDLLFRTSLTPGESVFTAKRGLVAVARHPEFREFPIGVALVLPAVRPAKTLGELFEDSQPDMDDAGVLMVYALATNPPRLGAGAGLMTALKQRAEVMTDSPSLVAFSPLTGMRARIIGLVDDARAWSARRAECKDGLDYDELREQLLVLLGHATMPAEIEDSVRKWLVQEAADFASDGRYRAGSFHRSMGAKIVGIAEGGDPRDSDAMWLRAYFEY